MPVVNITSVNGNVASVCYCLVIMYVVSVTVWKWWWCDVTDDGGVMWQMMGKGSGDHDVSPQEHYVVFDVHQARPLLLIEFTYKTRHWHKVH